jgi:hypothetical protein
MTRRCDCGPIARVTAAASRTGTGGGKPTAGAPPAPEQGNSSALLWLTYTNPIVQSQEAKCPIFPT